MSPITWGALLGAIALEVAGTTLLQKSQQFSRLWPTLGMAVCYLAAFYLLSLALKHFCRAVELNDSYLRGYYGLKLLARVLLPLLSSSSTTSSKRSQDPDDDVPVPSLSTVQKLDELATTQLAAMVRDFAARKKGASGYDEAEIAAVRELLGREGAAPR